VVNVTGPETVSVRWLAGEFARRFGLEPLFEGTEGQTALISNSAFGNRIFGYPSITLGQMIDWTAEWVAAGGLHWDKPTNFEARDGQF
jgi:nucleoside-diphosphate-sugar epimerase